MILKLPAAKIGPSEYLGSDAMITVTDFYTVVKDIRNSNGIAGVFLWNADLSKTKDGFGIEKTLSTFL